MIILVRRDGDSPSKKRRNIWLCNLSALVPKKHSQLWRPNLPRKPLSFSSLIFEGVEQKTDTDPHVLGTYTFQLCYVECYWIPMSYMVIGRFSRNRIAEMGYKVEPKPTRQH